MGFMTLAPFPLVGPRGTVPFRFASPFADDNATVLARAPERRSFLILSPVYSRERGGAPFVPVTLRANPNVIFTSERTPTACQKSPGPPGARARARACKRNGASLTMKSATVRSMIVVHESTLDHILRQLFVIISASRNLLFTSDLRHALLLKGKKMLQST